MVFKLRLISLELLKQHKRVRRAERIVRQDRQATLAAWRRFARRSLASPEGLAASATAGVLFDRLHASNPVEAKNPVRRLREVFTLMASANALLERVGEAEDIDETDPS